MDASKGDKENPEYRCRFVSKEIKKGKQEDLVAATLPLEAKKMFLSLWAGVPGLHQDFGDVAHAYFHARAKSACGVVKGGLRGGHARVVQAGDL